MTETTNQHRTQNMIKARPILFSSPMIIALLEGRKTQTRRIAKPSHARVFRSQPERHRIHATINQSELTCPYGNVGDLLWVRESWGYHDTFNEVVFKATDEPDRMRRWKPSIHMPRSASRLTLEITEIRVERLQDISRGDCMTEGCPFPNIAKETDPVAWYRSFWESINGADSWNANPWVWVIEFKVHHCNVDDLINKEDTSHDHHD